MTNYSNETAPTDQQLVEESQQPTEDFLKLFSTTLRSLAADAACIRQMSDMVDLLNNNNTSNATITNNTDHNPNDSSLVTQGLIDLDAKITVFEHKVTILRQIINEEKAALNKFESVLEQEASDQALLIEGLRTAFQLREKDQHQQEHQQLLQQDGNESSNPEEQERILNESSSSSNCNDTRTRSSSLSSSTSSRKGILAHYYSQSSPSIKPSRLSTTPTRWSDKYHHDGATDDHHDDDNYDHKQGRLSFAPVTETELQQQTRFGPHMCRYDINEALEEIEEVVRTNLSLRTSHRTSQTHVDQSTDYRRKSNATSFERELRSTPRKTAASEAALLHPEWCVSEQELRETCAFFRHGESTARSTLQLLCSLKRLKQVPSKHSQVQYLCLF